MPTSLLTILLLINPNFILEFIPVVPRSNFQEPEISISIRESVYDGGSRRNLMKRNGKTGAGTHPVKSQRWVACKSVIALDTPIQAE